MKLRNIPLWLYLFCLAFTQSLQAQEIVINEIMFSPATGGFEWIELFNAGPQEVNLRGWILQDRSGTGGIIAADDIGVPAGEYVIIASKIPLAPGWETLPAAVLLPTKFPSLNNGGDDILLHDAAGTRIDSVTYTGSWSSQRGVSTERLRHDLPPLRENWAASIAVAGGTPGKQNSVSVARRDPLPRSAVIINEIMLAPLASSCEWLELFNPGDSAIDLSRWIIAGKPDSRGNRSEISLPGDAGTIGASGFAVVAADSSIVQQFAVLAVPSGALLIVLDRSSLGLGNADDEILLLDPGRSCIDSVWYRDDWHHPFLSNTTGISLELMQPEFHDLGASAWSSCAAAAGGTPGERNSIFSTTPPETNTGAVSLTAAPNPFSPDGDGQEDFCVFHCRLPANVNQVRLRIYDVEGRQIAALKNNQAMGRDAVVVWDGLDSGGRRARIGAYVALLEGLDPASNNVVAAKTVVVVARRL